MYAPGGKPGAFSRLDLRRGAVAGLAKPGALSFLPLLGSV